MNERPIQLPYILRYVLLNYIKPVMFTRYSRNTPSNHMHNQQQPAGYQVNTSLGQSKLHTGT